jgi:2,3-dihydroxy-2,3-dihydro-p-cumate dehydrogenase
LSRPYEGQVALVTGAGKGTGGVGRAIAMALAASGARVMVSDIDPKVAETAAEVHAETGMETLHYVGSLAEEANVRQMVDNTVAAWGRIDILVNNAGGCIIRPFLEHDAASLTETLARNLWTAIWCCHKVLPHMVRQNYGRIVVTTSSSGPHTADVALQKRTGSTGTAAPVSAAWSA